MTHVLRGKPLPFLPQIRDTELSAYMYIIAIIIIPEQVVHSPQLGVINSAVLAGPAENRLGVQETHFADEHAPVTQIMSSIGCFDQRREGACMGQRPSEDPH